MGTGKIAPWALSAVLAVLLAGQSYSNAQKDQEIARLVNEANAKLAAANLPEATVRITTRKALFADGLVVGVENTSGESAAFTVRIERPSTSKGVSVELTIDSRGVKEIGQKEGWAFLTGDKVTVTQPNHKPRSFSI